MTILVTGATGNVGRLVVDELLAQGATNVRALTVNPVRAALPPQVEAVRGYLGRPETVIPALAGVDRMYLAPLLQTVDEVTQLAAAAGVRHIVDLAGDENTDWRPIELAVEASGVAWTHLEAGEFMANALMWAPQITAGDVVRDANPEAATAPIAVEDIAAVAARVLLDDGQDGKVHSLTGPETLTRRERIRQIGRALGRQLVYQELDRDTAIAELRPSMGEYAVWYVDGQASMVDHPQAVTTTVSDITGRPATTFAQWARANADLFR
ncbi:MAG TPA: NAD(P)H-binding protein [Actinoplanes sp.]